MGAQRVQGSPGQVDRGINAVALTTRSLLKNSVIFTVGEAVSLRKSPVSIREFLEFCRVVSSREPVVLNHEQVIRSAKIFSFDVWPKNIVTYMVLTKTVIP